MKNALLVLLMILPIAVFGQNCGDFKTGTFECKQEGGEWIPNYKIVRKKNLQIEYYPNGYNKSKVVWIDSCTYQLIHIKSKDLNLEKGNVTTVKIVETTEDTYVGVGHSEAIPGVTQRVVMRRIK